jgi:uncharacterized SAM-binding protein YcdF (DUF218 family)
LLLVTGCAGLAATTAMAVAVNPRDDPFGDPQAVIVLGGSAERAELGIAMADRFSVPLVLSSSSAGHARELGVRCGVEALCFSPRPRSTVGEARTVREFSEELGWTRLLIVTTDVHTSRARMVFRQCLGDGVAVIGASRPDPPRPRVLTLAGEAFAMVGHATFWRAC